MPSYSDNFWNEESVKKRVHGVARLLLSDYLKPTIVTNVKVICQKAESAHLQRTNLEKAIIISIGNAKDQRENCSYSTPPTHLKTAYNNKTPQENTAVSGSFLTKAAEAMLCLAANNILIFLTKFPNLSNMKKITFICFVLLTAFATQIQAQATLSIQGVIKNSDGSAVDNGNYSLTFNLYNSDSGGTPIWTETQNNVAVTGGIYSALLGESEDLTAAFDETYYLGVSIDGGTELTPPCPPYLFPLCTGTDREIQ